MTPSSRVCFSDHIGSLFVEFGPIFEKFQLFEIKPILLLLLQAGPQVGPGRGAGRDSGRAGRPQSRPKPVPGRAQARGCRPRGRPRPGVRPGIQRKQPACWPAQADAQAGHAGVRDGDDRRRLRQRRERAGERGRGRAENDGELTLSPKWCGRRRQRGADGDERELDRARPVRRC